MIVLLPLSNHADDGFLNFTARGMKIKMKRNPNMGFARAELLIFYRDKKINPGLSYLTQDNMFNRNLNEEGSGINGVLKRLGNDYEIVHRPDYLKISVNFLGSRSQLLAQLMKEIYNYKSFTPQKFKKSVANYWKYYLSGRRDWKRDMVTKIAYSHLFPGHLLGNFLVLPGSLGDINFAQILMFYNSTFTPENSKLFIEGNIEPYQAFEKINRAMRSYKRRVVKLKPLEMPVVEEGQKVIVFDSGTDDSPKIYWFHSLPPINNESHIQFQVLNNILFGFPTGVLFRNAGYLRMRNIRFETDIAHHHGVSVICNTISRINYRDIEKFIMLADGEKKKLKIKKINRKEYLDALNYVYGKMKVSTNRLDYPLENEINKNLYPQKDPQTKHSLAGDFKKIFTLVTQGSLNRIVADPPEVTPERKISSGSVIVIAGNASEISKYLNTIKPETITIKFK
jgi:hypothetical protein